MGNFKVYKLEGNSALGQRFSYLGEFKGEHGSWQSALQSVAKRNNFSEGIYGITVASARNDDIIERLNILKLKIVSDPSFVAETLA